ncbi:MAG: DUF3310 domain-containing protein [Achromobacter sp.]|uniref:DUF3310 domain-containing protein n=1 Tax=Achromobacter sp. TaxID=134375 RepID=UPI003CFC5ED1
MQHTQFKYLPQDRTQVPDFVTLYAPFWRGVLPKKAWVWNPWTGDPRAGKDIKTDPLGSFIVPPAEAPAVVTPPPADVVNHPAHYTAGGIECIDAIAAATTGLEGIEAACTANALKYLWRWKRKNGLEDLRKARWYINHLLGDN